MFPPSLEGFRPRQPHSRLFTLLALSAVEVSFEGAPTSKSVPIPFSDLCALCVSVFSSPNVDALDAASSLSPLFATLTKNNGGWGTRRPAATSLLFPLSILNCLP